jgi:toxin ParE1/3/4
MTMARFLLPAEEEMIAAAQYYEHQSIGLGTEFLTEVERTVAAISAHPNAAPKVKGEIRRRLLQRFPFGFEEESGDVSSPTREGQSIGSNFHIR